MAKGVLTAAQWRWVGDRWLEGYTMSELAYFLGLHRETVPWWMCQACAGLKKGAVLDEQS